MLLASRRRASPRSSAARRGARIWMRSDVRPAAPNCSQPGSHMPPASIFRVSAAAFASRCSPAQARITRLSIFTLTASCAAHVHPRVSVSASGRSSLAFSARAAAEQMAPSDTGAPASAARNAALQRDVADVAAGHVELREPLEVEPVGRRRRREDALARSPRAARRRGTETRRRSAAGAGTPGRARTSGWSSGSPGPR